MKNGFSIVTNNQNKTASIKKDSEIDYKINRH